MSRPEIFRISDKIPPIVPAELTGGNTGRVVVVAPSWQGSWHQCSLTDGYSGTSSRCAEALSPGPSPPALLKVDVAVPVARLADISPFPNPSGPVCRSMG
jgi:hypothetical protein